MSNELKLKQQELQTSLGDKADIQRKLNEQIRIQAENTNAQAMRLAQVIGPPPPEKSAQAPVIGSKRKKLGKERLRIRRGTTLPPPPAVLAQHHCQSLVTAMCFGAPKAPEIVYQGPSQEEIDANQAALDQFRLIQKHRIRRLWIKCKRRLMRLIRRWNSCSNNLKQNKLQQQQQLLQCRPRLMPQLQQ